MKKILSISILAIMIILLSVTGVNAATNTEYANYLYSKLSKYGMQETDKLKVERYLSRFPMTESQESAFSAKVDEAIELMKKAGKTSYLDLSADQKGEARKLANDAASILNLSLVFESKQVNIYKNGKFLDVVYFKNGKLIYTGSDYTEFLNKVYNKFSKYGMTETDKLKCERYLAKYPISESEESELLAKADAAVEIMEKAGKINYLDLNSNQKAEMKKIANEAANILNVTLVFEKDQVKIYKNGNFLDVIPLKKGKLVYTGNNNLVLVVSSIAVIALASTVVARKKLANA